MKKSKYFLYSNEGNTVLHHAVINKNIKLIFYLVKKGCVFKQNNKLQYPIDIAIEKGEHKLIEFLAKLEIVGIKKDNCNEDKKTKLRLNNIDWERQEEEEGFLNKTKISLINKSKKIANKFRFIYQKAKEKLQIGSNVIKEKLFPSNIKSYFTNITNVYINKKVYTKKV